MSDSTRAPLTRGMKAVVLVAAVLVAGGIAVAIWLSTSAGAGGDGDQGASNPSATATRGPVPGSTPTSGSEVLPPTETATGRLPSPTAGATPLVSGPLPKSGSANGALVDGFPVDSIGPMPDSSVLSSAIATEGDVMQATLVSRTEASEDDIREHYAQLWSSLGLVEGDSSGGNVVYVGPYESLTLAVSTTGTGIAYSIYGVFRTK